MSGVQRKIRSEGDPRYSDESNLRLIESMNEIRGCMNGYVNWRKGDQEWRSSVFTAQSRS